MLAVRGALAHHYVGGFDSYVYFNGVRDFVKGLNPYTVKDFVTPPSGLIALLPMRLVDFDTAYIAMMCVTTAAIVAGAFLLLRRLLDLRPPVAAAVAVLVAAVPIPTFTTIGFGSLNGLIFLTFVLCIVAVLDGKDRDAGLWLGVGLALKPVLFPFWLVFIIQRRYRAAGWSVVPVVVGSLVAMVINAEAIHFVDDGLPNIVSGLEDRFKSFNIAAAHFAQVAGFPDVIGSAARLACAVLMVGVAYALWRRYQRLESGSALEWLDVGSVLFAGTLLTSSFAWRYYVIFLFPLFARAARRGSVVSHPLVWLGALMTTLPDDIGLADALPRKIAAGRYTIGVALVLVGVGLALFRRSDALQIGESDASLVEPGRRVGG